MTGARLQTAVGEQRLAPRGRTYGLLTVGADEVGPSGSVEASIGDLALSAQRLYCP